MNFIRIRLHNSHTHTHKEFWFASLLILNSQFIDVDTHFEWKTFDNELWPVRWLYDPFIRRIFGRPFYLACMCERLRLWRRYSNFLFRFSFDFNETFVVFTKRNKWIIRNYILDDLLGAICTPNESYLISSSKKLIHCMRFVWVVGWWMSTPVRDYSLL